MKNKAFKTNWSVGDDTETLHALTEKNRLALISQLQYLRWLTRWDNAPDLDTIKSFTDDLEFRLTDMIDFCARVAECIDTSDEVQESIENFITNNVNIADYINNIGANGGGATSITNNYMQSLATYTTDDLLYGQALAIVDRICDTSIDVLQTIQNETTIANKIAQAIQAIPLFESLPIDELLQLKDTVIEDLLTSYESFDSTLQRQLLACDIFCMAKQTGNKITFQSVDIAVSSRMLIDVSDPNDILQLWLLWQGVTDNELIFNGMNATITKSLLLANRALDWVGIEPLALDIRLGDPSDDWELLCDTCSTPPNTIYYRDFRNSEFEWGTIPSWSNYVIGQGYARGSGGLSQERTIWIQAPVINVPSGTYNIRLTGIKMGYSQYLYVYGNDAQIIKSRQDTGTFSEILIPNVTIPANTTALGIRLANAIRLDTSARLHTIGIETL